MLRADLKTIFESKYRRIYYADQCIAQRIFCDMHYYLDTKKHQTESTSNVALMAGLDRWHERLGHIHKEAIRNMFRLRIVDGVRIDFTKQSEKCMSLIVGKSCRAPISKREKTRSTQVLALVHSDVCMQPKQKMGGSNYFVSFTDGYSRYNWVYSIKQNSDVFETLK